MKDKNWEILEVSRSRVDQFRRTVPLITDLKNPAMRQRHWDQVQVTYRPYLVTYLLHTQLILCNLLICVSHARTHTHTRHFHGHFLSEPQLAVAPCLIFIVQFVSKRSILSGLACTVHIILDSVTSIVCQTSCHCQSGSIKFCFRRTSTDPRPKQLVLST